MIVNEPESQSSITIILIWLEVRPCLISLEDCNLLVPNQHYVGNERVSEWADFFRVSSKHRRPTNILSSRNHPLTARKVLSSISAVRGKVFGNWSYQVTPQPVAKGLSIYSAKSSDVLFHHFQHLGPVPWVHDRYHFRVLVGFLYPVLVIHWMDLGELNICVRARAPNTFKILDIIYHALWVRLSHLWHCDPGLEPPPVVPPGLLSNRQRPSTDLSLNMARESIVIIPWLSLEMTTPTASSVSFILDNIAFAPLVAIVSLRDYALILGIPVIHFLMDVELEPFN